MVIFSPSSLLSFQLLIFVSIPIIIEYFYCYYLNLKDSRQVDLIFNYLSLIIHLNNFHLLKISFKFTFHFCLKFMHQFINFLD